MKLDRHPGFLDESDELPVLGPSEKTMIFFRIQRA